ncbi:MAG: gluconate 2-dehydrogenase subunit 3 family protein [Mycobacterium sp.]|uniref:gluconate 2-dehydrogenase subunit 3 family protein n=1 Tax=Mycobacterium sp. TaxID=1785 RepID=UPI003CC6494B
MADTSRPDHLPNLRPGGQPPHPSWLPKQRRGITPQMIGRYPDYDVLETVDSWDEATKKVVLARLESPGPLKFFTADEEPCLRAFCDTVLVQDRQPRVPVAEFIDDKLAAGRLDGYQYVDMPDDRDTWRLVLRALDETARYHYDEASFAAAEQVTREAILDQFSKGCLQGGIWGRLNVSRAWSVCMRMVLSGFYSHPWAWNEIGFGGPAYPRGFMRLGGATGSAAVREPFETRGATAEDPVEMVEDGEL